MAPGGSLAVIVPTNGKRPELLVRCLRSLKSQVCAPESIICASSTPDLPSEVRELSTVVVDKLGGASRAKNVAMMTTRSELLAFLDDDCVADERWLMALGRRFILRGGRLAGVTGRVLPTRPGRYLARPEPYPDLRTFSQADLSQPPWRIGGGLNMAFRTEPLKLVGGFDTDFGPGSLFRSAEELDLFYRILARGYEIDYDPEALVYHEPLDTISQIVRTRHAYRLGLSAFFAKQRGDPAVRAIYRAFLRAEIHDLKAAVIKREPENALVSIFGFLGLVHGTILANSHADRFRASPPAAAGRSGR